MQSEGQATDARFDFRFPFSCGVRACPDYNKVIILPIYYIQKKKLCEQRRKTVAVILCDIYGF